MNDGPVIIVDDDADDRELLREAWQDLKLENPLLFFNNAQDVLNYLTTGKTSPFLILCDVNIPKMDGFQLKEKIKDNASSNYKSIPFVFWSTTVSPSQIEKSYDLGGNGFFVKETRFEDLKQSLVDIVRYWKKSKVPE